MTPCRTARLLRHYSTKRLWLVANRQLVPEPDFPARSLSVKRISQVRQAPCSPIDAWQCPLFPSAPCTCLQDRDEVYDHITLLTEPLRCEG